MGKTIDIQQSGMLRLRAYFTQIVTVMIQRFILLMGGNYLRMWKIETAENCLTKNFKQLRCVNWEGLDLEYNTFGYTKKELSFLLGIFMAEGHTEKDNNRIVITQYKKACIEILEKTNQN